MRWLDTLPLFLATVANASPIQRRQETSAATVPWATLGPASTKGGGESAVPWSTLEPGTPIVPASTLVPASPIPTKGSSLDPRKEMPAESVPWATLVPAQTKDVDESAMPPSTNVAQTSVPWATLVPASTNVPKSDAN